MTDQTDGIKATGAFNIQVIDALTGKVLESYEDKNLVVTLGRTNICKLLGGDAAGQKVSKIAVGTGSVTPTLTDSGLTAAFSKSIDNADYPTAESVRFNWTLGTDDANGLTIQEFGLLNNNNVLFARKIRAAIVKTSAISIVGNWTININ